MKTERHFFKILAIVLLQLVYAASSFGSELPSLFRGIATADDVLGIRVVGLDEESQAYNSGLRPGDIIVQVNTSAIKNIDDFAKISQLLKGISVEASVFVLRNGSPKQISLHLYSFPILSAWGIQFVYDYNLKFIEPEAAVDYWMRMARGFEEAGDLENSLNAYLNCLHYQPMNYQIGLDAFKLFLRISRKDASSKKLDESVKCLGQGIIMLEHLFQYDFKPEILPDIKYELQETLNALHATRNIS